jgi:choline dehydrogenase-like flavoprotein
MKKRALVIGSGAGGATVASELQGPFDVTVLEAGDEFRTLGLSLKTMERIRRLGLLRHEREIRWFIPTMRTSRTAGGMILVHGEGLGGTTTVATGNGIRLDRDLQALGIDLDPEFESAYREIPVGTAHQRRWRDSTRALFDACQSIGLEPMPTPKMGNAERCVRCGRCVLGCQPGAKWDSRRYLRVAIENGAKVVSGCRAESLMIDGGCARGVVARHGLRREYHAADLVVLAAGGFGTAPILHASGIPTEPRLFVDPVLCVAAEWKGALQCHEISMPFVVQRPGFIISPYFDYLSFLFNPAWRYPARDILPLMIKLADSENGTIRGAHVAKTLTDCDQAKLADGVRLCTEILHRTGVHEDAVFFGSLNAGHPGGTLPLTRQSAESFHDDRLPANVYVADASLFPRSLGNPPILTIVAMAKRISSICRARWSD